MEIFMKRFFCIILVCTLFILPALLTSCGKKETLNLGLGVYTTASATDASENSDGEGRAITTVAAVLVDKDGKIASAFVDRADNRVFYGTDGKAVATDTFETNYEQGDDYDMEGTSEKAWYEQADAFCKLIKGKSVDEIKSLSSEELRNAGCTISTAEFVRAIEKAAGSALASNASADDILKIGVFTSQSVDDATEDRAGSSRLETTFFAAALDAEGKITAASSDCLEVNFTFDTAGASAFDPTKALLTKREQGDDYNMVEYGGANKEWYAQAAAFDALSIGKSISDVGLLAGTENHPNGDLIAAGCTIKVDGFIRAASKLE